MQSAWQDRARGRRSRGYLPELGAAFATGGAAYDRLRPGYPDDAVDWLLDGLPPAARAADVGAGTGKLTAALVRRGCQVVAVDPSAAMVKHLSHTSPSVGIRHGRGEATGLPDAGADLVTYGQSWHWIEPEAGVREPARVLRPGGRGGWIWNFMDVRVDWVADLAAIWHSVQGAEAVSAGRQAPVLTAEFTPLESLTTEWFEPMAIADLAALVTTRSYYLNAAPEEQQQIREQAARFLDERFPGESVVELPYLTHTFRASSGPMLQR